jgi:NADH-quinone oxidoreductase subunit I
VRRPEDLNLLERLFVTEVIRGLFVTGGRFWRNLFLHIGHQFGVAKGSSASATLQYPEQYFEYGSAYRGSHRLTLKDDDSVRCTACFLCATACPARCIHIEAGEHPDPTVEKFPLRYEIDTLRCIYCGMCVEACPCDAIRMDTSVHPRVAGYSREDFIEDKGILMGRSRVMKEQGEGELMKQMIDAYKRAEPGQAIAEPLPGQPIADS